MSDVMLFGVLGMPYKLAMSSDLNRHQFWQRAQDAIARIEYQENRIKELESSRLKSQPHCEIRGAAYGVASPKFIADSFIDKLHADIDLADRRSIISDYDLEMISDHYRSERLAGGEMMQEFDAEGFANEIFRLIRRSPKHGNTHIHTFDTERKAMVELCGECCLGGDPFCTGGCLVQKAIRKNMESKL